MQLETSVTRREGAVVLAVSGEVDLATAEQFQEAVRASGAGAERLVVDLRQLGFLDSSGVRALLVAARDVGVSRVSVVCPPGNTGVRQVLDAVRFDELVPVLDDLPAEVTG